jgi:16S rRNA (guanine527-N7)-methyltransferase
VEIHANRLEEVEGLTQKTISHITCRAVTEIGPFLEMVATFSGCGAQLVCMKGPRWSEELEEAGEILAHSGYVTGKIVKRVLPRSGVQRTLLFFDEK